MKIWYIPIEHTATGTRYLVPIPARTKKEALTKASAWPYTTDAFTVIKGETQ